MSDFPFNFGDFEELRKRLEQMRRDMAANNDLPPEMQGLAHIAQQFSSMGFPGFVIPGNMSADELWNSTLSATLGDLSQRAADPAVDAEKRQSIIDAGRLAQSWLDSATAFVGKEYPVQAMLRDEWLENTWQRWRAITEPIADGVAHAANAAAAPDDDDLSASTNGQEAEMAKFLQGLQEQLWPLMRHGIQQLYLGRVRRLLVDIALDTLSGSEVGVSLFPTPRIGILTNNVGQFTRDIDLPEVDVLLYLLIRETARIRLFDHVAWLGPQVEVLLNHYARETRIDEQRIIEQIDPANMMDANSETLEELHATITGSFFETGTSPEQLEVLEHLELLLACIEGWVNHVTTRVATQWMPDSEPQLKELIRRRRGSAGPTQTAFETLIGLELTPRLVRDAENLWASLDHRFSVEERDLAWSHPDVLPTLDHLADPLSYVPQPIDAGRAEEDDLDRQLRQLLEEEGH